MLKALLAFLLGLICFLTFNLGMDYVNLGYGLHPAIAFPVATVSFIGAVAAYKWTKIDDPVDKPYKAK